MLSRELVARGHAVRGTTREPARLGEIEATGAEAVLADPDRVGTLVDALEHVTVACVLLGSAAGAGEQLASLHSTRLEMLLTKVVDTTIRGVVYEARGTVEGEVLAAGAARVRAFGERSLAGWALLGADPADHALWLAAALAAIDDVLEGN
jgi:uncharacterized protein YbjT (DUF2867 family)